MVVDLTRIASESSFQDFNWRKRFLINREKSSNSLAYQEYDESFLPCRQPHSYFLMLLQAHRRIIWPISSRVDLIEKKKYKILKIRIPAEVASPICLQWVSPAAILTSIDLENGILDRLGVDGVFALLAIA